MAESLTFYNALRCYAIGCDTSSLAVKTTIKYLLPHVLEHHPHIWKV